MDHVLNLLLSDDGFVFALLLLNLFALVELGKLLLSLSITLEEVLPLLLLDLLVLELGLCDHGFFLDALLLADAALFDFLLLEVASTFDVLLLHHQAFLIQFFGLGSVNGVHMLLKFDCSTLSLFFTSFEVLFL